MAPEGAQLSAVVPGHITGFFSIHREKDPSMTGSRGGGITITDGVTVRVRKSDRRSVLVNSEPHHVEPVLHVLDELNGTAVVDIESDLPLGTGFGVSGAMTLGTALVGNAVFEAERSENELITLAHTAEVKAGTGLGDVVAQARGGLPLRLDPGGPNHNRLDGIPDVVRVEHLSFGTLSTEEILAGKTDRITSAGERALSLVRSTPTIDTFMRASRRFAMESGLCPDRIAEIIDDVADVGGQASMAMLGRTVFAVGSGLSDAGYDPTVCHSSTTGASLRH